MSKIVDTLQLKFDELNILTSAVLADSKTTKECEDAIEDLLIMAYADGVKATADVITGKTENANKTESTSESHEMAGTSGGTNDTEEDTVDELHEIDTTRMFEIVNQKVDGKDFRERVAEYFDKGDGEAIQRVAETETHRIYNQAVLDTASKSEKTLYKTWVTMMDDKVREAHFYLEGERKPLNEEFVTIGGYSAQAPGLFGVPSLDCNCRCGLDIGE